MKNRAPGHGVSHERATRYGKRPARRDRRGRGVRGMLAFPGVPLARSRADAFDDLVLDAVEELESRWAIDLAGVEFAVEDVPPTDPGAEFSADVVLDRGVALGRLYREGLAGIRRPTIVVYRRPLEVRAADPLERGDVVFAVVAELVAEYLGRDIS